MPEIGKNRLAKFNGAIKIVLLWSIGIVLLSNVYNEIVIKLMEKGIIVKKNIIEYSPLIFYLELCMYIGMLTHLFKRLGIFKGLNLFCAINKKILKNIVKFGVIGCAYGIVCVICVFIMYFFIIGFEYGLAVLAMHERYGSNWIGLIAVIVLISSFVSFVFAGIKEGIMQSVPKVKEQFK